MYPQHSQRNFRYQPFPQAPFVPEAPYSGMHYGKAQTDKEKQKKAGSAGLGILLGAAFLLFLPVLLKSVEDDMKKLDEGRA